MAPCKMGPRKRDGWEVFINGAPRGHVQFAPPHTWLSFPLGEPPRAWATRDEAIDALRPTA